MTTHADRLTAFRRHRIYPGNVVISWRGIAMVWDRTEPVLETVHVEDAAEFLDHFHGFTPHDENAETIVSAMPATLCDAASDAYLALAEEDGCRVSTDPMTGEQRLVQP